MLGPAGHFVIDYHRGVARLSPTITISVSPADDEGQIRVGGGDGPVVRPLTFGERGHAVAQVASVARPYDVVCANVLSAATVQPASENWDGDPAVLEALTLLMAGAGQPQALPFAEVVLLVARASGWDLEQINRTHAIEIDRLSYQLAAGQRETGGWKRLLLVSDQSREVITLRHELAADLLRRAAVASLGSQIEEPFDVDTQAADSQPGSRTPQEGAGDWQRAAFNSPKQTGERRNGGPTGHSSKALRLRSASWDISESQKGSNGGRPQGTQGATIAADSGTGRSVSPSSIGRRDGRLASATASQEPALKTQMSKHPGPAKHSFRLLDTNEVTRREAPGSLGRQADSRSISAPAAPESTMPPAPVPGQVLSPRAVAGHGHSAGQSAAMSGLNGQVVHAGIQGSGQGQIDTGSRPGYLAPEANIEPAGLGALENMAADLADTLATLLSDEADIRGIDR